MQSLALGAQATLKTEALLGLQGCLHSLLFPHGSPPFPPPCGLQAWAGSFDVTAGSLLKLNVHGVSQPQWWATGAGAVCWKGILGCALAGCSHPLLGSVPAVTPCAQPCTCVYGSLCINHLFSFQDKGAFWLLQKLRQSFEEGGVGCP